MAAEAGGSGDAGASNGAGAGAGGETKSSVVDGYEYATPALKEYLETHTVDSFIARRRDDLVVIDCTTTAKEALKTLLKKGISSAPVYLDVEDDDEYMGSRYRYLGFVDAMDLTALALNHGLETKPTGGFLDRVARFLMPDTSEVVAAAVNLSKNDPFVSVYPGASLTKVFEGMARGFHRIAIEDPSTGEILGLMSQGAMVRMLAGHRYLLGRLAETPLGDVFNVDPRFKEVYCISELAPASLALKRMVELRIGGMPLIDDKFRIVTNISATDIRSLGAFEDHHFTVLEKSCIEFVAAMRTKREEETTKAGGRPGPLAPSNGGVRRAITMSLKDTFGTMLNLFAFSRLHRLYIVNEQQIPVGVITMRDVLRALVAPLGRSNATQAAAAAAAGGASEAADAAAAAADEGSAATTAAATSPSE